MAVTWRSGMTQIDFSKEENHSSDDDDDGDDDDNQ
jgi:hypothetical protein